MVRIQSGQEKGWERKDQRKIQLGAKQKELSPVKTIHTWHNKVIMQKHQLAIVESVNENIN